MNKLKKSGIIRRIGPTKGGHWEIINQSWKPQAHHETRNTPPLMLLRDHAERIYADPDTCSRIVARKLSLRAERSNLTLQQPPTLRSLAGNKQIRQTPCTKPIKTPTGQKSSPVWGS
jgi:hypothetical protein